MRSVVKSFPYKKHGKMVRRSTLGQRAFSPELITTHSPKVDPGNLVAVLGAKPQPFGGEMGQNGNYIGGSRRTATITCDDDALGEIRELGWANTDSRTL